MGGDGGKVVVQQIDAPGLLSGLIEVVGNHGDVGGVVVQGQRDGRPLHNHHLIVNHGVLALIAGLVHPVLNDQSQRDAGGHREKIGIDAAQHMVPGGLGVGDRPVDADAGIDGLRSLKQDGLSGAVRGKFKGKTLDAPVVVDGNGIAVG